MIWLMKRMNASGRRGGGGGAEELLNRSGEAGGEEQWRVEAEGVNNGTAAALGTGVHTVQEKAAENFKMSQLTEPQNSRQFFFFFFLRNTLIQSCKM